MQFLISAMYVIVSVRKTDYKKNERGRRGET
jgi:hypothetical protein